MVYTSRINVLVKKIIQETPLIKRFLLSPINKAALPSFSGGSHITTFIQSSGLNLQRSYSLCGNPSETQLYQIAIKKQAHSNGGSLYWHNEVKEGFKLQISYPKNYFPLSFKAKHHVFFAAGIGITPFIPMMLDLQSNGKSFELHYAAKSKIDCAFYKRINVLFPSNIYFYFSNEGKRMLPEIMQDQLIGTHVYFCGPQSLIKQFTKKAIDYGYPKTSIHFELFSSQPKLDAKPFEVELHKSGQTFYIPKNQSLLKVLLEAGIKVPFSCQVGRCGTCAIEVLSGEIDHQDYFLSDKEKKDQKTILPCVSRCKSSKLILDY
ncbi:2Fe-2S iron-sulfur cluster binding domain-containing protein [Terrilactibacillus sp. BCM23-1]|uniref:2Fe-2S iron-sulfur cluster binding domain-containing protein n=1 Tax=Terrilactibacillus tamarindi TaxID=2599694 RepID=A0A6N8CUH0_9BACI|nr:PDR/VanB family oxidoreductase [Terrilactibacillus tamarindi]MTT32813.1 2Fe-2S iron-sulfur cluster binding domain-containing protein [Terrilactibacillus tamarindi]